MILADLKSKAIALAALAGLSACLLGAGYFWGTSAARNAVQAEQTTVAVNANHQLQASQEEGKEAASLSIEERKQMEAKYAELKTLYDDLRKRAPLVVYRPAPQVAQSPADAAPAGQAPGGSELPADADVGAVPALTLAAVRMWNGSLAGEDLGAGACRAGDPTGETNLACAADSGLDLDDAWRNQAINAKTCASDRARYQRLIDFLNKREASK